MMLYVIAAATDVWKKYIDQLRNDKVPSKGLQDARKSAPSFLLPIQPTHLLIPLKLKQH